MKRIFIKCMVLAVSLTAFKANALGVVENFCNEDAFFQSWIKGTGGKQKVNEDEVLALVDPRFRSLIEGIVTLPPKVEEKRIFDIVKTKPRQDIRVRSYTAKLTWYFPEKEPVLALDIFMYKGCISTVSIIGVHKPRFFFSRRTQLSNEL